MTDSTPVIVTGSLKGRPVPIRRPNETQLALMHHQGQLTDRSLQLAGKFVAAWEGGDAGAQERAVEFFRKSLGGIAEILDIIGYLVVEPEDVDWIGVQLKAGAVEVTDLLEMFDAFQAGTKPKKVSGASRAKRTNS